MIIAVISDLHSNIVALEEVLEDIPSEVDKLFCCGDIVGYGPRPKECVEKVIEEADFVVKGNHDRAVSNKRVQNIMHDGRKLARKKLSSEQLNWFSSLPEKLRHENIMMVHSHPTDTDKYVYPKDFPSMRKYISKGEILLLGHTHIMHTDRGEKLIINPGSVGQPRDGTKKSSYAIIDTEELNVEIRRISYDIEKVEEQIKELGLPDHNYQRLYQGE